MPSPGVDIILGSQPWTRPDYPKRLPNLAAWFDALDLTTMTVDSANRVSLWADKSGNSSVNVLCLNGVAGNYASAPDSVPLSITGDIDIRVNASLVDWTPAASQYFLSKWLTTGVGPNSYIFGVSFGGALELSWSTTGSNTITKLSTASPSVSDLGTLWIRCTLDVDNGATGNDVKFYTSTNGSTWTQLGATVTTAGVTSIFDSTTAVNIGAFNGGANSPSTGNISRVQIRNNILDDGTGIVFDADFAGAGKLASTFTESSSNAATVTINTSGATGARICGARDLYQGTVANQPVLLRHTGENYGYFNAQSGYLSTPSAAANKILGDIEIVARISTDWSGTTTRNIVAKRDASGTQYSYQFVKTSTAYTLQFLFTQDGSTQIAAAASSSLTGLVTDYAPLWVKVTRVSATGAVAYFYSTNGSSWTALGTASTTTGNMFDSTSQLEVGANRGGSNVFLDKIYYCDIKSTIAGAAVQSFDPSRYVSGSTFVASTGETWTLNGGATVVTRTGLYFEGVDDYLKAAAFALVQPETVYFVGSQVSWIINDILFDGHALNSMVLYMNTATPTLNVYAGTAVGALSDLAVQTPGIKTAVFNGAAAKHRTNRNATTTGDSGAANANGLTLGVGGNTGTTFANILVSELPIYAAAHGTTEQDRMALWAGKKWGIPGI